MKPLKLVMNAFGPYKNEVEIDFENIGRNGIFLITGDTGSGKTTIFDGISFSLFGSASGSRRETNSFRSDFASDDVKTYVHFSFIHKGIVYYIERVPRYSRKKVRGEGMTTVGGDASLTYLDEVITGDKNVTDKCIEILGMNASQFKQIVMIAQGEFMELLLAKPKDRAEILRHIFDTTIYKNISDSLKSHYLDKRREYEDSKLSISNYLSSIIWNDDKMELSDSILDIMSCLNDEIRNDKIKEEILEKEKKKLEEKSIDLVKKISEGKFFLESKVELEKNKVLLNELIKQEFDIKIKEEKVIHSREIWDKVYYKKCSFEDTLRKYKKKDEELSQDKTLLNEIKKTYQKKLKVYQTLDKLKEKVESYKNDRKDLEDRINLFHDIDNLDKEISEKYNYLNLFLLNEKKDIQVKFQKYYQLKNEIDDRKNNFQINKERYLCSNKEYLKNYDLFISSQVGILARSLEDGKPCPVCGSFNHPNKVSFEGEVLSKEELDKEKNELDKSQKVLENISREINELDKEYSLLGFELESIDEDKLIEEVENLSKIVCKKDINGLNKNDLEKEISHLKVQLEEKKKQVSLDDSISDISNKIKLLDDKIINNIKKFDTIQKDYEESNQEKIKLESLVDVLEKEVLSLENEKKIKEKEYVSSYQGLGYQNEDDYLKIWLSKENINQYEDEIKKYKESISEVRTKILSLEKFIKGKHDVDLEKLESLHEDIMNKMKEFELDIKNIHFKLSNNIKIYDHIMKLYNQQGKLEHEVMIYKDLSDTANGTISGQNKLEFEQFVQASYFDKVIYYANKRLSYMTDDRFQLMRKDEATKISDKLGLELEVMDYYTGKRRDIKSLSGGESFKAALSLALGMSDTIQMYSGGVVVDAMFIDEGFGSLDMKSLESAMNAIMMLSQNNRMIGIISHVSELKSRIDNKIVVEKSGTGSCVNFVT